MRGCNLALCEFTSWHLSNLMLNRDAHILFLGPSIELPSSFFWSIVHLCSNSRSNERTSASHANGTRRQRQLSNPPGVPPPIIPLVRRSNGPRGLATSQPDQSGGFFNFPPPGPSSRNPHETENSLVNRIHPRERNHLPHPVVSFEWESVWGPFRHAHGGSSTNRSGNFWGGHRS